MGHLSLTESIFYGDIVGNMASTAKLAVLIDAENAQASRIGLLLAEVAKYGTAHVKRAYGDWTGPGLVGWKDSLLRQSIQPIQQFAYTQGKNSSDSAMIIDAMDLLFTNRFDGFCLVSSDSDFTRLASRIRESGLVVYGFGERKTPQPFVAACDKFVYVEILGVNAEDNRVTIHEGSSSHAGDSGMVQDSNTMPVKEIRSALVRQLRHAVEATSNEDGWANLAKVGSFITKQQPDFDARNYGYDKLINLVTATRLFIIESRSPGPAKPPVIYVCVKTSA